MSLKNNYFDQVKGRQQKCPRSPYLSSNEATELKTFRDQIPITKTTLEKSGKESKLC